MSNWPPPDPATVLPGDCRATLAGLPPGVFQTCITSIPYWGLRAYGTEPLVWGDGWAGEYGSEPTVEGYVAHTVEVFRAVRRVLRPDATLWINVGDAYTGGGGYYPDAPSNQPDVARARGAPGAQLNGARIKTRPFSRQGLGPKQLLLLPARVALALQSDGWICRSEIIWAKQNPLPESVTDRPTKAHEQIYLFSLAPRYYYDQEAVRENLSESTLDRWANGGERFAGQDDYWQARDGSTKRSQQLGNTGLPPQGSRNLRDVWPLASQSYNGAHFAVFPDAIPRRAIRAGSSAKGQCPACGAPWRRVTAKTFVPQPDVTAARAAHRGKVAAENGWNGFPRGTTETETTGWAPTCTCDAGDPVPQWVLDPFAGSGTTLAVARSLGRAAVGCELQPAYLPLSARRIAQAPVPLPALVEHL